MNQTLLNIVLYEPEIPQNTGNIARLCACVGAKLFLIGRLGFSLSDRHLKRAGLDYWDKLEIDSLQTLDELIEKNPSKNFYYFTTKAKKSLFSASFSRGDFFVFGPETRGIPEDILNNNRDFCLKIPMKNNTRSLNLSNSVAVGVYEAVRQFGVELN